jgi:DnaK suppressor protein
MAEKTRYSDKELVEFRELIERKLASAREELKAYQDQIKATEDNDDDQKYTGLDDGTGTVEKEYLSNMAGRQIKFIQNLENAMIRIENKTYGICRKTGKLIEKQRLLAVPHATLSMEAKLSGDKD